MPLLFLNDTSCGTGCDPARADRAMTELAQTVLTIVAADRPGTRLVSKVPLNSVHIAAGHPIGKWYGQPRNRDAWLRMLKMQTSSPFKTVFPEGESFADVEYRHQDVPVEGLGAAHLMGGVGVSLPVDPRWDADRLVLEREQLTEDGGASEISEAEIRHASSPSHLDGHLKWIEDRAAGIRRSGLDQVRRGAELWERRETFFPHLQWLPRVEKDLRDLPEVWVKPVRERLFELEEAAADWDPATRPIAPQWRSFVRQEFESRRRFCWFPDLDGTQQLFDWHSEFLPKPGRLHFRLVSEEATLRVAYVGRKRGID
ncbi:hypothetical protein [Streptomyces sp. NPDC059552]|uniref:hypothetical protein n=1 Tax=Streptomyces sp. NPDC059552 TaxID=3346862 RepID=UPI003698D52F